MSLTTEPFQKITAATGRIKRDAVFAAVIHQPMDELFILNLAILVGVSKLEGSVRGLGSAPKAWLATVADDGISSEF